MISEIAAWLFALFVVDPLHAEIRERVDAANLPVQALQQSQQCVATHGPRLLQRAGEEPVWATGTAIGIATGWLKNEYNGSPQRWRQHLGTVPAAEPAPSPAP